MRRAVRLEWLTVFFLLTISAVMGLTMGSSQAMKAAWIEDLLKLVKAEHPSLGVIELFGHPIWSGWMMIAALAYSVVPPVVLGRMKLKLSKELHEKTLHADASMNKADWMTGSPRSWA